MVFTKAVLRTAKAEGRELLTNVLRRIPVAEAEISLAQHKVVKVLNPPKNIKYDGIPVPVY